MVNNQPLDSTRVIANLAKTEAAVGGITGVSVWFNLMSKYDANAPEVVITKPETVIHNLLDGQQQLTQERWTLDAPQARYESRLVWPSGVVHQSVMAAFDGHTQRWYLTQEAPPDAAANNLRTVGFINEENHSNWNPQFTSAWGGNFGGDAPFSAILRDGKPLLVGTPVVNGFKTLQLEATQETGEQSIQHTAWLAPERSYREIRKAITIPIPGAGNLKRHTCYETSKFIQFGDQWIPQAGHELDWLENEHGPYRWRSLTWWRIVEIKPLSHDTRSIFALDFPLGTIMTDGMNQSGYAEGGAMQSDLELLQTMLKRQRLPKETEAFVRKTVLTTKTRREER